MIKAIKTFFVWISGVLTGIGFGALGLAIFAIIDRNRSERNSYKRPYYTSYNSYIKPAKDKSKDDEWKYVSPKIIEGSEYWDPSYDNYDKVTLVYYNEDGILATKDNEIIDDVYLHIGNALTKYGFATDNSDTMYVRNFDKQVDYEVFKIFGAYDETK